MYFITVNNDLSKTYVKINYAVLLGHDKLDTGPIMKDYELFFS